MDLLLVALLVLAVAGVVAVALGRVGGGLTPAADPTPAPLAEPLAEASDLDRARFGLALRGYRMDQVDAVLDEARDLLAAKEAEIERLRHAARPQPASVPPTPVPPTPVPPTPVPPTPVPPSDDVPAPVPAPVDHPVVPPPARPLGAPAAEPPAAP